MQVILYKYNGRTNTISKELPTSSLTLEGVLKEGTSLLNPSILIESTNYDRVVNDNNIRVGYLNNGVFRKITYNQLERLFDYNYAYIPDFKRYYFITDISSFRTNLWRIDMKVDVLKTYEHDIISQTQYVSRYESASSYKYKDNLAVFNPVNNVEETEPTSGSFVNTIFNELESDEQYNVVVSTISSRSLLSNYDRKESFSILPEVEAQFLESPCTSTYVLKRRSDITSLAYKLSLSDYSKYSSFVLSAVRFPMTINHLSPTNTELYVGNNETIPNIYNSSSQFKNYIVGDFTYTNDNITSDIYEQTTIEIYIPYLGWVRLNTQDVMDKRIVITYDVNYYSGESNVSIIDYNNNKLLYYSQCQLGTPLSLTSSNKYDVDSNNTLRFLNMALSLATTAVGASSGNTAIAKVGLYNSVKNVSSFITGTMTNYVTTSGSVTNALSGNVTPQKVRIKVTYPTRVNRDEYFAIHYGYPFNETIQLYYLDYGKYFKCDGVQLIAIENATKTEQDEIKSLLESGVYK